MKDIIVALLTAALLAIALLGIGFGVHVVLKVMQMPGGTSDGATLVGMIAGSVPMLIGTIALGFAVLALKGDR